MIRKGKKGTKYCVVVGNFRRNHIFYNLTYETEKIFTKLGLIAFDKVVLSNKKITPIRKLIGQTKRFGYSMKVHQTLLVYIKS